MTEPPSDSHTAECCDYNHTAVRPRNYRCICDLISRLRLAALECSAWSGQNNPPYTQWSDLMDEAAGALENGHA